LGPLAIYVSTVAVLLLLSIAVRIWKHTPTRKCHLCGAQVELGRRRCQVCGYEFIN
jgi:predicted amidophosphoribosyltransferase